MSGSNSFILDHERLIDSSRSFLIGTLQTGPLETKFALSHWSEVVNAVLIRSELAIFYLREGLSFQGWNPLCHISYFLVPCVFLSFFIVISKYLFLFIQVDLSQFYLEAHFLATSWLRPGRHLIFLHLRFRVDIQRWSRIIMNLHRDCLAQAPLSQLRASSWNHVYTRNRFKCCIIFLILSAQYEISCRWLWEDNV